MPVPYQCPDFESLQNCFVTILHQFPGRELPLQSAWLRSLGRASRNQYYVAVNCKIKMYCSMLPSCKQLQSQGLKFLCIFQVVGGKRFCIVLFSPFLMRLSVFTVTRFVGRHFFQRECCVYLFPCLSWNLLTVLPSFSSIPVFCLHCLQP